MGIFTLFNNKKKIKAVEINEANFNQEIAHCSKPIVLDFYASWCQPCQVMHSLITRMVKEQTLLMKKLKVAKVDIDANPRLVEMFGIRSVPTILFIYNKNVMERHSGLLTYQELVEKCTEFAQDFLDEGAG